MDSAPAASATIAVVLDVDDDDSQPTSAVKMPEAPAALESALSADARVRLKNGFADALFGVAPEKGLAKPAEEELVPKNLTKRDAKFAQDLRAGLASKDITSRSAVAQRMEREFTDEEKEAYRKSSYSEKQDFRLRWAEKQLPKFFEKKIKKEAWRSIDVRRLTLKCSRMYLRRT